MPGPRSLAAQAATIAPLSATRPAKIRSAEISQASFGFALIFALLLINESGESWAVLLLLTHGLDKGDLVDLLQRGQPFSHFIECRFAQEPHTFVARSPTNFGRRLFAENHLADAVAQVEQFVNRGTASEARTGTLYAALALIKWNLRPLFGIQPACLHLLGRVVHYGTAGIANDTNQPLRQNTVQRGHEIVGLYAHIEKSPNHVDHVVGVDGCEHQVTGEGRLDGDLRGFRVADFPHHDLVRIVAQNGTQSTGKGQTFLLVDGNLRDAANLVLHRIFNGDDLVFFGFNLIHGGVKSRRFAAARRPGNQHHAIGFLDVAAELAQVLVVKANDIEHQGAELLAHGFFVEHTEHRILAVNRRHDGDAKIDGAPVVLDAEAAILRDTAFGNIELAHDLDSRNDGRVMLFSDRGHGLRQHAVDAELDTDGAVARFDVNVTGAALLRGENGGIHQANNGAGVARRGQLIDRDGLVLAALVLADDIEREAFAGFFQHP